MSYICMSYVCMSYVCPIYHVLYISCPIMFIYYVASLIWCIMSLHVTCTMSYIMNHVMYQVMYHIMNHVKSYLMSCPLILCHEPCHVKPYCPISCTMLYPMSCLKSCCPISCTMSSYIMSCPISYVMNHVMSDHTVLTVLDIANHVMAYIMYHVVNHAVLYHVPCYI